MKARVKATGEIVNVELCRGKYVTRGNQWYSKEQLIFSFEEDFDYWEKLKHQYAGMAMQGILSNQDYCKLLIDENNVGSFADDVSRCAKDFATALVEKLKNE